MCMSIYGLSMSELFVQKTKAIFWRIPYVIIDENFERKEGGNMRRLWPLMLILWVFPFGIFTKQYTG